MAEEQKEEVKIVLNKYDKKQLRWNIIKFVIWLVLLALSRWYIQNHPAEKVSVFSGFDVLWQKVEVFFHNTFKWNWDLLERKYSLEKYYKELLNMAEWNECLDNDQFNEISEVYEKLKAENNETLNETLPWYIENAYKFEAIVQDDEC
jgi:hypothetical protein